MPDKRRHRGPDPEDEILFSPKTLPGLRSATSDLCWLLSRGYAAPSAVEIVGNRYALSRRQRLAVSRCACPDAASERREQHRVGPATLANQELWLDGFNVVIGLEAALSGGVVLRGRDGCCRDLANVYARYRAVEETVPTLRLVGERASAWKAVRCRWWLDRPVSNSGRFKEALLEVAAREGWNWEVELVFNPDKILAQSDQIVATSDSVVLDRCERWLNLLAEVIEKNIPQAHVIDLWAGGAQAA